MVIKQLIDLAIACGRKRLSPQTGYIHHCSHALDEEVHYPIPVVENALFALALMRSKTSENILEAKNLLERLLHFQNEEGNFPIYLHEYPKAHDRYLGAHLLLPFHWILKQFASILGADLRLRLQEAFDRLLEYTLKSHVEKPAPYPLHIKIAAIAGDPHFDALITPPDATLWFHPQHIGDILSALQVVYPSIAESSWEPFWKHLGTLWHHPSCSYAGPALKDLQKGFEPKPSLYDLYMGYFSGAFSKRALADSIFHLQAALIQPTDDKLVVPNYPCRFQGHIGASPYYLYHTPSYAYSVIRDKETPLRIVWGTPQKAHTFVLQKGNIASFDFQADDPLLELRMNLGEPIHVEDREENRELAFYFDASEEARISVDGHSSSTFQLGQELMLHLDGLTLSLNLTIEEGTGHFFGHLMRGNRPSQISLKGTHRHQSFDWQVFLRTLRRSELCRLKASLKFSS